MSNGKKEGLVSQWLHTHDSWLRRLMSTRWLAVLMSFAMAWYVIIESVNQWKKTGDANFTFAIWIVLGSFALVIWYIGNRTYEHKKEMEKGNRHNHNA